MIHWLVLYAPSNLNPATRNKIDANSFFSHKCLKWSPNSQSAIKPGLDVATMKTLRFVSSRNAAASLAPDSSRDQTHPSPRIKIQNSRFDSKFGRASRVFFFTDNGFHLSLKFGLPKAKLLIFQLFERNNFQILEISVVSEFWFTLITR